MFMIGLIVGGMIGAIVSITLLSCMYVAHEADKTICKEDFKNE